MARRGKRTEMDNNKRIPDHYKAEPRYVEDVIDYVECIGDMHGFCRGNIIKYIVRAGRKTNTLEDLYKAREYINRWIQSEESKNDVDSSSDSVYDRWSGSIFDCYNGGQ